MISVSVHGLAIALPCPVKGLRPLPVEPETFDVIVAEGSVEADGTEAALGGQVVESGQALVFSRRPDGDFLATVSGDPLFCISAGGDRVTVADWDALAMRLLADQVLPLIAELHGLTAVHATTVLLDGRAVAIAGPSGSGKSTLASRLGARGATLIAEDVSAMSPDGQRVFVQSGQITVRRRPGQGESPASDGDGKLTAALAAETNGAHLGAFVLLTTKDLCAPPSDAMALLGQLFVPYANDPSSLLRHLDLAAAIARDVPIVTVCTQVISPAETEAVLLRELAHATFA